jgi:hypothetical protein
MGTKKIPALPGKDLKTVTANSQPDLTSLIRGRRLQ